MENVLILSADKWEFPDETTGEIRKGVSLQYITDYRDDSEKELGFKPIKASVTENIFDLVKKGGAPAMYKLDMRTRPGKDGKPTVTIIGAQFVKPVKLFEAA